jgi:sugar/nucleoside kinase (ribokinase family)
MKRLAFLGAMNRDLVADIAGDIVLKQLGVDAPALIETPVSDAMAETGARLLFTFGAADYLGGSAFNAARVAALLNASGKDLDLSIFGIAGQIGPNAPHLLALAEWGVASAAVLQSPHPPATCLAMVESAGRTLLTATGANAGIAAYLRDESGRLAQGLAACELIHITSFLEPASPGLTADLLVAARKINPDLMVSLDPGAAWIMPGGEGLDRLLAHTDILHLNNEELAHFGGNDPAAIVALGTRLRQQNWLIVARNHCTIAIHQGRAGGPLSSRHLPDVALPANVLDSTGAGDTFCGAFLWHFGKNPNAPLQAARHGFALARAKIAQKGPLTAQTLPI